MSATYRAYLSRLVTTQDRVYAYNSLSFTVDTPPKILVAYLCTSNGKQYTTVPQVKLHEYPNIFVAINTSIRKNYEF